MPSFMQPEGWEMPPDAQPGKPFQAVGTFMVDENGTLELIEIDGSPIEGYEQEEMVEVEAGTTAPEEMMMRAEQAGLFK